MNIRTKESLRRKIKNLEGLTAEERTALLGLLDTKTYGLVWEEKPEAVEEKLRTQLPVLREVPDKAILSDDAQAPNHIIIEGDNLEALNALAYTHEGKIDVIYIDPPYNTGNKDFVYNDSFVDKEDEFRHSKWLSFMSKRLNIAKRLLSDKGVIFISIDDNELAQLKLLCDEIFGAANLIGVLPRVTKKSGKDHSENIANNNDYIIVFAKQILEIQLKGFEVDSDGYDYEDEYITKRGKYKLNQTLDYNSLWYNPKMDFPIENNGSIYYPGGIRQKYIDRHNGIHNPKDWVWRWSKAKFDFGLENGFVVIKSGRDRPRIYTKTYYKASIENDDNRYFIKYIDRTTKLSSLAFTDNTFSNDNGKKNMAEVIDANAFDFPKPCELIKYFLILNGNRRANILDFFAGSGTTLHATMQLNAEDGGHRRCILVNNNENNICERVTYERNKRVIEGYTTPKGVKVEGLKANNLRYYRTEFVDRRRTMANMRRLMDLSTDMLCIKEDIYSEQPRMAGVRTSGRTFRYFAEGTRQMLVIYREEAVIPVIGLIKSMEAGPEPIKVYVFSPSQDPWEDDFEEVMDRVELCALPAAILNAYKRTLPKETDPEVALAPEDGEAPAADAPTMDLKEMYDQALEQ